MKTRCPACATTFRVTPEQLKARAGKVRCGQCDSVFNALDTLIDELVVLAPLPALATGTPQSLAEIALAAPTAADPASASDEIPVSEPLPGATGDTGLRVEALDFPAADAEEAPLIELAASPLPHEEDDARETIEVDYPELREDFVFTDSSAPGELIVARTLTAPSDAGTENGSESEDASSPHAAADGDAEPATRREPATGAGGSDDTPASPPAAPTEPALGALPASAADGGVLPRQMTEIPGYSKWSEGTIASPAQAIDSVQPGTSQTTFVVVATLLALVLAGQAVFHFRSEIAASAPSMRRALVTYADMFGAGLPPLRHAEQISIEGSDLQADPARSGQLLLLATLANRAPYAQALPMLELTLTDTHDQAVARKVFPPEQYLPDPTAASAPFAPRSEIALRLPIETRDIAAAGYRLYVFYP